MEQNKYLISVDIEGITGVIDKTFSQSNGKHYHLAQKYLISDVNAVVSGIVAADSSAWIAVRDAHGDAINIDLEKLHQRAHLIQGWGNNADMIAPIDETYKGLFLVGYHAGAQNQQAVLAHTMLSMIHQIKVNDRIVNEAGLAGIYASHYAVPVAFISGDDHVITEAKEQFSGIVGVVVKESIARDCAISLSLAQSRSVLEKGAVEATQNLLKKRVACYPVSFPLKTEIKLYSRGVGVSVYQRLYDILSFDKVYQFDHENFIIKYYTDAALEMVYRLNLIMQLLVH